MLNSNDNRLAKISFTLQDLKKLAIDEMLKDSAASKALEGKRIRIEVDLHVFKWDNPEYIATFTAIEDKNVV